MLRQLEAQSSSLQMGALSVSVLCHHKLGFGKLPENPSLACVPTCISKVEASLQKVTRQRQTDRVTAWKEKMRHDWYQSRRQVFQWLENEPFSVSLMKKPDGKLTGNLQEMDRLVKRLGSLFSRNMLTNQSRPGNSSVPVLAGTLSLLLVNWKQSQLNSLSKPFANKPNLLPGGLMGGELVS